MSDFFKSHNALFFVLPMGLKAVCICLNKILSELNIISVSQKYEYLRWIF